MFEEITMVFFDPFHKTGNIDVIFEDRLVTSIHSKYQLLNKPQLSLHSSILCTSGMLIAEVTE
jgi:hypothetical protein